VLSSTLTASILANHGFAETFSVIFSQSFNSLTSPISLTALPGKIMERIIRDVMIEHLFSNNIFVHEQHGFFLNKSTINNLLETANRISEGIDNGWNVLVVFLDFAKGLTKCTTSRSLLFVIYINDMPDIVNPCHQALCG